MRNKTKANEAKAFKASMTVEASIALPLFIFFFVNIMTLFNIVKIQCDMEAAMHQTGNRLSMEAFYLCYGKELLGGERGGLAEAGAGLLGILQAKDLVLDYLGPEADKSCISEGREGISFIQSRILMGNDIVDIIADYKVHPLIPVIGFEEFTVESRYYGHAWTGYDIELGFGQEENEEEMVYVTEHGEVYHRSTGCEHLKINVSCVEMSELDILRNKDGKKYKACEYCGGNIGAGTVFVTQYGDRYHSSVGCTGLKRKIYTIPISEVGGRRPCSSCG